MTFRSLVDANIMGMCKSVLVRVPMFGRMFSVEWRGSGVGLDKLFFGSASKLYDREVACIIPTASDCLTIELKGGKDPTWLQ